MTKKLTIVGIGGSAGGIEAIETFLVHVPHDSGMAFVIVVHMSHSHACILPELILCAEHSAGDTPR